MQFPRRSVPALITAAALAALAAPTHAAVIVAADNQTPPSAQATFTPTYAPSTTDLIQGLTPTASAGNFTLENSTGTPALTDGLYPTLGVPNGATHPGLATAGTGGGSGSTVTYTLAGPSTINSIAVYGGWNDNGRDQQLYNVEVNTGSGFVPLALTGANTDAGGNVNFNPNIAGALQSATHTAISDSGGAALATGVTQIRFNFPSAPENGYTGYAEIDVQGTAATPEPASLGFFGLAALGLLRRRRPMRT